MAKNYDINNVLDSPGVFNEKTEVRAVDVFDSAKQMRIYPYRFVKNGGTNEFGKQNTTLLVEITNSEINQYNKVHPFWKALQKDSSGNPYFTIVYDLEGSVSYVPKRSASSQSLDIENVISISGVSNELLQTEYVVDDGDNFPTVNGDVLVCTINRPFNRDLFNEDKQKVYFLTIVSNVTQEEVDLFEKYEDNILDERPLVSVYLEDSYVFSQSVSGSMNLSFFDGEELNDLFTNTTNIISPLVNSDLSTLYDKLVQGLENAITQIGPAPQGQINFFMAYKDLAAIHDKVYMSVTTPYATSEDSLLGRQSSLGEILDVINSSTLPITHFLDPNVDGLPFGTAENFVAYLKDSGNKATLLENYYFVKAIKEEAFDNLYIAQGTLTPDTTKIWVGDVVIDKVGNKVEYDLQNLQLLINNDAGLNYLSCHVGDLNDSTDIDDYVVLQPYCNLAPFKRTTIDASEEIINFHDWSFAQRVLPSYSITGMGILGSFDNTPNIYNGSDISSLFSTRDSGDKLAWIDDEQGQKCAQCLSDMILMSLLIKSGFQEVGTVTDTSSSMYGRLNPNSIIGYGLFPTSTLNEGSTNAIDLVDKVYKYYKENLNIQEDTTSWYILKGAIMALSEYIVSSSSVAGGNNQFNRIIQPYFLRNINNMTPTIWSIDISTDSGSTYKYYANFVNFETGAWQDKPISHIESTGTNAFKITIPTPSSDKLKLPTSAIYKIDNGSQTRDITLTIFKSDSKFYYLDVESRDSTDSKLRALLPVKDIDNIVLDKPRLLISENIATVPLFPDIISATTKSSSPLTIDSSNDTELEYITYLGIPYPVLPRLFNGIPYNVVSKSTTKQVKIPSIQVPYGTDYVTDAEQREFLLQQISKKYNINLQYITITNFTNTYLNTGDKIQMQTMVEYSKFQEWNADFKSYPYPKDDSGAPLLPLADLAIKYNQFKQTPTGDVHILESGNNFRNDSLYDFIINQSFNKMFNLGLSDPNKVFTFGDTITSMKMTEDEARLVLAWKEGLNSINLISDISPISNPASSQNDAWKPWFNENPGYLITTYDRSKISQDDPPYYTAWYYENNHITYGNWKVAYYKRVQVLEDIEFTITTNTKYIDFTKHEYIYNNIDYVDWYRNVLQLPLDTVPISFVFPKSLNFINSSLSAYNLINIIIKAERLNNIQIKTNKNTINVPLPKNIDKTTTTFRIVVY